MTTDTRIAREREAMRRQPGSHLPAGEEPDAKAMGAESAEYIKPSIDPQWIDAWKLFIDPVTDEQFGVPARLPKNQWSQGGPNALENQRHPDGRFWFTLVEPERKAPPGIYPCFVGDCKKMLPTRIKLVNHIPAFHHEEAETYSEVLKQIKQAIAQEDPRLQQVLASMKDAPGEPAEAEDGVMAAIACDECGASSPDGHESPEAWLRGHKLGAHKEAPDGS